ncbi:MAG: Lrp/AsnC family transcriptional regulator [Verrucomicrobia bacterium]|nr:Lrp/AsnC family transcriptional regulator [Verrucomicrobiota bacterium]MDA1065482.1 Lrp/AsnC family transcriptional regulator [Verrucomicrobiota bacterium]
MEKVLQLLVEGESLNTRQIAAVLNYSEEKVEACLEELKKKNILLGWRPVFNPSAEMDEVVRAVIEVKIKPERGGGFDKLAERISRFDEVESCYLMSGGYDLQVVVKGKQLSQVAGFISERLATIDGVLSTATHFLLRTYKEQGFLLPGFGDDSEKPKVSP